MIKVIKATCVGDVVTAEGFPIPIAELFSFGDGASSGLLFIDADKAYYVANTSPDVKTTIEKVIDALGEVKTALDKIAGSLPQVSSAILIPSTAVEALGASGVVAAVTATTANVTPDMAAVTAAGVNIAVAKTALETLKGVLK